MASFGMGKSVPNQGGIAKANVAPSLTTAASPPGAGTVSTPDLGKAWASKVNMHVKPVGGSGKTHGSPKGFKK